MFNSASRKSLISAGTVLVLSTLATAAHADRIRNTTHTLRNGQTVQREAMVQHPERGSVIRSRSVAGPEGRTASSTLARDYDASTQTLTRDRVVTGPEGNTASRNAVATRTENGATRQVVSTGPNGKTITREGEVQRDGNTVTGSRSITGPDGATVSQQGVATYDADSKTLTQTRTTTAPDGTTATKTTTRTVDHP